MAMFRPFIYRKCLEFLHRFWRGSGSERPELGYLTKELLNKQRAWWKKANCTAPSSREAHMAASVFVEEVSSGGFR